MQFVRMLSIALGFGLLGLGTPPAVLPAGLMPDLMVSVQLDKVQREGRWFASMTFRVKNVGSAPAAPSTLGAYCQPLAGGPCPDLVGNYVVGPAVVAGATGVIRLQTPAIPAGGFVVVPGPRTKPWANGNYRITARADVLHVVAEGNEANNTSQSVIAIP